MNKNTKLLKEDIVSFATAKLAKTAGFWYDGNTNDWLSTTLPYHEDGTRPIDLRYKGELWSAPTQALLQRWLRDKHKVFVEVNFRKFAYGVSNGYFYICGSKKYHSVNSYFGKNVFQPFDTYEDALEVGLQQGLKIVIDKINEKKEAKKEKKQVCSCTVKYFDGATEKMKCINCGKLHDL